MLCIRSRREAPLAKVDLWMSATNRSRSFSHLETYYADDPTRAHRSNDEWRKALEAIKRLLTLILGSRAPRSLEPTH